MDSGQRYTLFTLNQNIFQCACALQCHLSVIRDLNRVFRDFLMASVAVQAPASGRPTVT